MPSLREIRGHIRSVAGISQVIHAMESVSAVTSHRLQVRVAQSATYADALWRVLMRVAQAEDPAIAAMRAFGRGDATVGRTALVVVSSNRGMAGPYDQNVLHVAMEYTKHLQGERELITVGERGRGAMLRRGVPVAADWSRLNERLTIDDVAPLSTHLLQRFESGEYGRVAMAYTQYREGVRGRPTVRQLLPVAIPPADLPRAFLLEPDAAALLQALLPRVIQAQVYEGVLESFTAEHTARVFAMHSAGTNATELSGSLRLSYNKTRQEAITAEMSEVTSVLALESGS